MSVGDHIIHVSGGRLTGDTPRSAVDGLVERALLHGGNGIVIHFHGGLVSLERANAAAEVLHREYLQAGAYPVFFVWESGLVETVTNNLASIAREAFFKLAWKRIAGIVKRKLDQSDDQRAAGALPPADDADLQVAIDRSLDEHDPERLAATEPAIVGAAEMTDVDQYILEQELLADAELTAEITRISNGLRTPAEIEADAAKRSGTVHGSTETLMDPAQLAALVERPDPTARGILSTAYMVKKLVSVGAGVLRRFVDRSHHGFHATIIEEILRGLYLANVGGVLWSQMKQDTADAFGGDDQAHGGDAFLAALRDRLGDSAPPRIILVGHSAGAIFVSRFIARADDYLPESVTFDVVLEAPASTFDTTAATLHSHAARISGFRMFAMRDEIERDDRLVPFLYPHSLLYFVSGVVEGAPDTPLLGMERFHDVGRFPDADYLHLAVVRDYLAEVDGRAVWSVTGDRAQVGLRSTARRHGDFDDRDAPTLESVKHILRHGYAGTG